MAARKRRAEGGLPEAANNVIEAPIVPRRLTVSEILRDRRIECQIDVEHVAQVLRIRPAVLTDIEAGRFDQLPGPAYAVGFVRSYATYLGLDAEALVLRFKAEVEEVARRPHLNFPLPLSDTRVPTGTILFICILLAALTYGGWYYISEGHGNLSDIVQAVPDRLNHLVGPGQLKQEITTAAQPPAAPVAQTQPAPPAPAAAPAPQPTAAPTAAPVAAQPATPASAPAPALQAPAPAAANAPAQPQPPLTSEADAVPPVEDHPAQPAAPPSPPATPDLAQPAVSDTAKSATQSVYGAPDGQARIVLHAVADSWVQVRDHEGNLLITRVLKPGETYNVPNQPGLTMVTGNAGGLDISIDGTTIARLGEDGRVVRGVNLDPDRLLAGHVHAN